MKQAASIPMHPIGPVNHNVAFRHSFAMPKHNQAYGSPLARLREAPLMATNSFPPMAKPDTSNQPAIENMVAELKHFVSIAA